MQTKPVTIAFFGSQQLGVTILDGLVASPFTTVTSVITQPDRPAGRQQTLTKTPVKERALMLDIPVDTPATLKGYQVEPLAELFVVAEYGLLIPKSILDAPRLGVLNVHPSLLPRWRGATPVQSALLSGETETGVSIMQLDAGMDTGPVLLQEKVRIDPDETFPLLNQRLARLAVPLLLDAILQVANGIAEPKPQDDRQATVCGKLSRASGKIDWSRPASAIYNQYRALTPWPGIWTQIDGKRIKLIEIAPAEKNLTPGRLEAQNDTLYIGCGEQSIKVLSLQPEGKHPLTADAFIRGYRQLLGVTAQ